MSGEGGLRGRDARGRAKRNLVTVTVCKVSGDRSCVDAADSGAVVDWVGRAVVLQDPRDVMSKGGLEKCKPGPRARVLGDQSVGRVDRPQRAHQELRAEMVKRSASGKDSVLE